MELTLINETSNQQKTSSTNHLNLAFSLHECAAYLHDKTGQERAVLFLLQAAVQCATLQSAETVQADLFALLRQDSLDDDLKVSTKELDDLILSAAELLELRSSGS